MIPDTHLPVVLHAFQLDCLDALTAYKTVHCGREASARFETVRSGPLFHPNKARCLDLLPSPRCRISNSVIPSLAINIRAQKGAANKASERTVLLR